MYLVGSTLLLCQPVIFDSFLLSYFSITRSAAACYTLLRPRIRRNRVQVWHNQSASALAPTLKISSAVLSSPITEASIMLRGASVLTYIKCVENGGQGWLSNITLHSLGLRGYPGRQKAKHRWHHTVRSFDGRDHLLNVTWSAVYGSNSPRSIHESQSSQFHSRALCASLVPSHTMSNDSTSLCLSGAIPVDLAEEFACNRGFYCKVKTYNLRP